MDGESWGSHCGGRSVWSAVRFCCVSPSSQQENMMVSTLILLAALVQSPTAEAAPAKQWYTLSNLPGWQGYGPLNENGWVLTEKFRRLDNPTVEVPPAPSPAQAVGAAVPAVVGAATVPAGDPYGFTNWLNSTRASYGLPAVGYDPNLESWAAMNNDHQASRGIGHFVMGPARRQNAAMGGFPGVESMWMASPAHRAALLDPTIRFIGIAAYGAYWTFNAN
jgi:hypothetical protein